MHTYTVSFFGHRFIKEPLLIEKRLEVLFRKLLGEKEYIEFLVGRNGEFDQLVVAQVPCSLWYRTVLLPASAGRTPTVHTRSH